MKFSTLIIVLFVFNAVVFNSCIDKEKRPDYYFKFKVDGVEKNFKATKDAVIFLDDPKGTINRNNLNMISNADTEVNSIVIAVRSTLIEERVTYTMQEPVIINGATLPQVVFIYWNEKKKAFGAFNLKGLNPDSVENASVRISEYTDEGGYGTFSGVLVDMEDDKPLNARKTIVISDGEFFLPVYKNYSN